MKRLFAVLVFMLSACVHPQVKELQEWSAIERAKAERGEIKFSDYYKSVYSRMEALPSMPGKAENMESFSRLIMAAQLYESGTLSKELFDNIRRTAQIEQERMQQASDQGRRQAIGNALQNFGNTVYGPEATKARQFPTAPAPSLQQPQQINCETVGTQTVCRPMY